MLFCLSNSEEPITGENAAVVYTHKTKLMKVCVMFARFITIALSCQQLGAVLCTRQDPPLLGAKALLTSSMDEYDTSWQLQQAQR